MSKITISSTTRTIMEIIQQEGGQDLTLTQGGKHLKIRYTFEGRIFQQSAPRGDGLSPRWMKNFRSNIRNRHKEKTHE